jgi:nicotinamide-nucleotide amidase
MNPYESAKRASLELLERGQKLAVAESCTGGKISRTATMVVGSSQWFDAGFITYSNESKTATLGVDANTIEKHNAVSKEVATEMVAGVLKHSLADYALAVTGMAGPGGGSQDIPVGQVFVALQKRGEKPILRQLQLKLDRHLLQCFVAKYAYDLLCDHLRKH